MKLIMILFFLGLSSLLCAQDLPKIAVLKISNKSSLSADEILYLTNQIQSKIQEKLNQRYQIITQANISELLPSDMKLEDCSKNECEVSIGRNIGVQLIVTGQALTFGNQKNALRLILKVHETQNANLLSTQTIKAKTPNDLENQMPAIIDAMIDQTMKAYDLLNEKNPQNDTTVLKKDVKIIRDDVDFEPSLFYADYRSDMEDQKPTKLEKSPEMFALTQEWYRLQNALFVGGQRAIALLKYFHKKHKNHIGFTNPYEEEAQKLITAFQNNPKLKISKKINWIKIDGGILKVKDHQGNAKEIKVNSFYISQSEITIAQYFRCVHLGLCPKVDLHSCVNESFDQNLNHPMTCISWDDARIFSKWVGGDLPSEVQWEYVANPEGKESKLESDQQIIKEVCHQTASKTKDGVCDLFGNALEWVLDDASQSNLDLIDDMPRCIDLDCNSIVGDSKIIKGNSNQQILYPTKKMLNIGFRVVKAVIYD